MRRHLTASLLLATLAVASAPAAPAAAQCAGDCDADGAVAINELITGVNIALGTTAVSACPSFDGNGDDSVAINELITAVTHALVGCAAAPTATPTPTSGTPATATATPTSNGSALCGNGVVNLGAGETCDDGNRIDTDGCPATCRVETCEPGAERVRVALDVSSNDAELFLIGMTLFLRYPDGVLDVPGVATEPPVLAAVVSDLFAVSPRDFDYGVRLLLEDPSLLGYTDGTAATVELLVCQGASAPPVSALSCLVEDATDPEFVAVDPAQIGCTLRFVP